MIPAATPVPTTATVVPIPGIAKLRPLILRDETAGLTLVSAVCQGRSWNSVDGRAQMWVYL